MGGLDGEAGLDIDDQLRALALHVEVDLALDREDRGQLVAVDERETNGGRDLERALVQDGGLVDVQLKSFSN